MLYLFLFGPAVADQALFDRCRRVLENRQTECYHRADRGTACLAELERRGGVTRDEDLFDCNLPWPPLLERRTQAAEDLAQAFGEGTGGGTDTARTQITAAYAVGLDDAKTGNPGTGVDTEHPDHHRSALYFLPDLRGDVGIAVHLLNIIQVFQEIHQA